MSSVIELNSGNSRTTDNRQLSTDNTSSPMHLKPDTNNGNMDDCFQIALPLKLTNDSFLNCIQNEKHILFFLRVSSMIWSCKDDNIFIITIQYSWNIFVRLSLFILIGLGIGNGISGENKPTDSEIFLIIASVTVSCQVIVLLPSLRDISNRLHRKFPLVDLKLCSQSLPTCWYIFIGMFFIGFFYPLVRFLTPASSGSDPYLLRTLFNVEMFIAQWTVSGILAANMLFILTDCKISILLINQLLVSHEHSSLTIEQLTLTRNEIKQRVHTSYWLNCALVAVAILDIIAAIFTILFLDSGALNAFAFITLYIKEFPFIAIVFYYSASVNEKSDQLLRALGKNVYVDIEKKLDLVTLYIDASSERISFPMAGMRMNYKDITRQLIAWLFALLVAFIKTLIGTQ